MNALISLSLIVIALRLLSSQSSGINIIGRRTAIHGSLRHMTTMDGGNADIAGANICRSNPWT